MFFRQVFNMVEESLANTQNELIDPFRIPWAFFMHVTSKQTKTYWRRYQREKKFREAAAR
jgi:hypothetical protein